MTNKDFHTYIFDELTVSYDSQSLLTNRPGDDLMLTPGKRLIVELHGVRSVDKSNLDRKVRLELYNADNDVLLCWEEGEPDSYDKEVMMVVDEKVLQQVGKYYIRILNAVPKEDIQSRFDEWKGACRYTFFLLKKGEEMVHPVLKKVSLASDLKLVLDWEESLTVYDRLDVIAYNEDWELMGKVEHLCFRSSHCKTRLNSPFIWTDGSYFIVLSHNQEPFMRIDFDWKNGVTSGLVWEEVDGLSPYYMLEKHLRKDTSWQRWQKVPGAAGIRRELATRYVQNAFNLMRMEHGLPECWEGGQHCALVVQEGLYNREQLYSFSQLVNPSLTFEEKDCRTLLERRNNETMSMGGVKDMLEEWNESILCLHHLSALTQAGGNVLLRAIEERMLTLKQGILMLVGSAEEIQQVREASAVIGKRIPQESIYRMGEYSLAEQVHWVQRVLINKHFTLTPEAEKVLVRELGKRRNWRKEALVEWMEKELYPRFTQRVVLTKRKEEGEMKRMLSTLEAVDIHFSRLEPETDEFAAGMEELNKMVGLGDLKSRLTALFNRSRFECQRRALGLPVKEKGGAHMIFTGNPGTGKTTVARMVGRIGRSLGLLSKGGVIVTERSKLVGRYIGDTENNVQALLEQAKGNVLFIDEAYNLCDGDKGNRKDFGHRVIESLLTVLAQKNPDLIVVLAGYEKEMMQMLESNPGMKGRFPYHFKFKDYDAGELMQIACNLLKDSEYVLTPEAEKRLKETIEETVDRKDAYFHNARWVEQYIQEGILIAMSDRLMSHSTRLMDKTLYQTIEKEDVENAYRLLTSKVTLQSSVRKRIGFVA